MRPVSAVDSVSLAVQRTRDFLFRPFRWGTFLKLGLVAIVTEGLGGNFNSGSHGGSPSGHGPNFPGHWHFEPEWIIVAVAALLLALVVTLFVYYLITRLRFAYFHCLIHNTREIRPGWWMLADQATRFFWLCVSVGFCFLLLVGLVAMPFINGFLPLFHESQRSSHFDVGLLLALVLPLIPVILLFTLVGIATHIVLRDCMMPHYALENATAGEAWSRAWARIMAEKRQFFVYALLRVLLPVMAWVALFFLLLIPGLVLAGSLAAVELGLHSAFADATGGSAVTGYLLEAFFGVLAFGFMVLASICVGGPMSTGVREYALVFYGGRFQALGDILYPPVPRPQ